MKFTLKAIAVTALAVCAGAAFAQKGETVRIAFMDQIGRASCRERVSVVV